MSWQDSIDLDMLTIQVRHRNCPPCICLIIVCPLSDGTNSRFQAKPVRDNPELLPVCYRCSYTNPLLNPFQSTIRGEKHTARISWSLTCLFSQYARVRLSSLTWS
jgi:hypothetical protein